MLDALSRKPVNNMLVQLIQWKELLKKIIRLDLIVVRRTGDSRELMTFQTQPILIEEIREAQKKDLRLQKFKK